MHDEDVILVCPYCKHPDHKDECSEAVADGSGGHPCGCIPPPWYEPVEFIPEDKEEDDDA